MGKRKNQPNCQNDGQNQGDEGNNQNEENKADKKNKDVVIKVYMHCEGCANKVHNCLKGFDGVEDIVIDNANQKVIVKGKNVDPMKVLGRLQKKYSKNVVLISPRPRNDDHKDKKEVQKNQEHKVKILVLKIYMHCEGCANDIKKSIGRMEGIMSVEPDMKKSIVIIRGLFNPTKVVEKITKQLGKHAEIVKEEFEQKRKEKNQTEGIEKEIMVYPPQYQIKYIYPSSVFSDENVFACSIM